MTFSANHAPFAFSDLRAPFSLSATSVNLGLNAILRMRSSTATAVASTISMSELRGRAYVVINCGTAFGATITGYDRAFGYSIGTINSTTLFGKTIKAFFFDGGFGATRLVLSGSASAGVFSQVWYPKTTTSYTAIAVPAGAPSGSDTEFFFTSNTLGFSAGVANTLTFFFDD